MIKLPCLSNELTHSELMTLGGVRLFSTHTNLCATARSHHDYRGPSLNEPVFPFGNQAEKLYRRCRPQIPEYNGGVLMTRAMRRHAPETNGHRQRAGQRGNFLCPVHLPRNLAGNSLNGFLFVLYYAVFFVLIDFLGGMLLKKLKTP